mmetsp:Transcript_116712/g.337109  ORF Transcript_116712/g.337109 Transcript_116712/m.337109 type:complete len:227 (-) Transcript_116712:75-755(-)
MSFCTGSVMRVNTKDTATLLGDDKFMALEEEVEIIPRFSSDGPMDCITCELGPFRAHTVAKVPLWAGLEMAKLQLCAIEAPAWLHEEELKRLRDIERDKSMADLFGEVPEHYIEIAFALLTQSNAFASDPRQKTRTLFLMRELIECRRGKIIKALKSIDLQTDAFEVTNMSAAERSCFRTRSTHIMDTFVDLAKSRRVLEKDGDDMADEEVLPEQSQLDEDSSTRL